MERSATNVNENPFIRLGSRYARDPVKFAEEVLGVVPDEWQREFLMAVADPKKRRISVRSGHGVGKSTAVAMASVWHIMWRVPGKVVMTAPTSAQLFDALFAEVKRLCRDVPRRAARGVGWRSQPARFAYRGRGVRCARGRV